MADSFALISETLTMRRVLYEKFRVGRRTKFNDSISPLNYTKLHVIDFSCPLCEATVQWVFSLVFDSLGLERVDLDPGMKQ